MQIPDNLKNNVSIEELYRIITDFTYDWEELRDLEDNLIYISPSCERITGYSTDEFYNHHRLLVDIIHPDDLEKFLAHNNGDRERQAQGSQLEFRLIHRDGQVRWIGHQCQPAYLPDGRILGIRSSNRDITTYKQAETEAAQNYQTVLALMDNPVVIALMLDLDGAIRIANQTFAMRFGKSQAELVGMIAWDLLPEPQREKRRWSVQRVIETGKPVRYQDQGVHGFYDHVIYPIFDDQGRLFQIGVQARDITQIMEERAALQESQATIRSLIDIPSTIMLLLDTQGKVVTANAAFAEMLRAAWPEAPGVYDLPGKILWEILPRPAAEPRKAGFEQVLSTGETLHVEEHSPSGAWYDTWVYPIRNEQGEIFRIAVLGHDITARKQAEDTIRQDEATIRALLNVPDMMIILLDLQGKILLANSTFAEIMHRQPEALQGQSIFALFPPASAQFRQSVFDQVAQSGQPQRVNDRSPDGRLFDSLVYPILNPQGQAAQIVVLSRDLTEVHQTAAALEKSERNLRSVLNHFPGILFILDPQGTLKLVDGYVLNTLGLEIPKIVNHTISEVLGAAYDTEAWVAKIMSGELTRDFPTYSGHTFEINFSRVLDQQGQVVEVVGIAQDKTEERKIQDQLQQVKNQLEAVLEGAGDSITVLSREGKLTFANQAAAALAGFPSVEAYRSAPLEAITDHYEILDEFEQPIPQDQLPGARAFSGKKRPPVTMCLRDRRTGYDTWVETRDTPILDQNGQVQMVVAITHDISQTMQKQHKREQSSKELERLATESAAELQRVNEQLLQENQVSYEREEKLRLSLAQTQALAEVSARLNANLELEIVLETITREIIRNTHYPLSGLMLYNESKDAFYSASTAGKHADTAMRAQPLPRQVYEQFMQPGSSLIVIDDISMFKNVVFADILKEIRTRTTVSIPLRQEDGWIGCLNVMSIGTVRLPTEDEKMFLQGLASLATTAITNARLYQKAQTDRANLQTLSRELVEAQETERRKLARELHDNVGQMITYLDKLLERSSRQVHAEGRLSEEMNRQVTTARQMTQEILQHVRGISKGLRPAALDDLGLLPALGQYFAEFTDKMNIQVEFKHNLPDARFSGKIENAAYHIIQQALVNVARHAKTDKVNVRMWLLDQSLGMQIEDHGVGFDSQAVLAEKTTGGLPNLREQVALLGGSLEIDAQPGIGTCVTVEIPLVSPAAGDIK